jgi:uncharacterized membrane protein (DUF4010 family)
VPELFQTANYELLRNLAIALFIGGLIGVERQQETSKLSFGGLRTFALLSLVGVLGGWLTAELDSVWPVVLTIGSVAMMVTVTYNAAAQAKDKGIPGITTEISAISVTLLGAMCALGMAEAAVIAAIALSGILTFKAELHKLVELVGEDDLVAMLKLMFATFIVLPLLPNVPIDPWGALIPWKIWLLVVLISTLSLIGYVGVRCLGETYGMLLTGVAGGLVSSTAVTLTLSRQSNAGTAHSDALASGVMIAWGIMFVRVVFGVAVVYPPLVEPLVIPLGAMCAACFLMSGVYWFRGRREDVLTEKIDVQNPFSLTEAAKFGALFAVVLLVVAVAKTYASEKWLYLVSALAGSTDVDPVALSMAQHASSGLAPQVAVICIVLACVTNTVVKAGMVVGLAERPLAHRVGLSTVLIGLAGAAAVAATIV